MPRNWRGCHSTHNLRPHDSGQECYSTSRRQVWMGDIPSPRVTACCMLHPQLTAATHSFECATIVALQPLSAVATVSHHPRDAQRQTSDSCSSKALAKYFYALAKLCCCFSYWTAFFANLVVCTLGSMLVACFLLLHIRALVQGVKYTV